MEVCTLLSAIPVNQFDTEITKIYSIQFKKKEKPRRLGRENGTLWRDKQRQLYNLSLT